MIKTFEKIYNILWEKLRIDIYRKGIVNMRGPVYLHTKIENE